MYGLLDDDNMYFFECCRDKFENIIILNSGWVLVYDKLYYYKDIFY